MRSFAASAVATAVVVLAACSSGGAPGLEAPAPWSPVGTYAFTTSVQGMSVDGTMVISRDANGLGGRITVDPTFGIPPIPFETVDVADKEVTITADADGEAVFMVLLFDEADSFDGSWSMAGDGGDVSGRKTGS